MKKKKTATKGGNASTKSDKRSLKKALEDALPDISSKVHQHLEEKPQFSGLRLSSIAVGNEDKSQFLNCHVDENGNWVCE